MLTALALAAHLPETDLSAVVVQFIGSALVAVAGLAFGWYALANLRLSRLESHAPFWRYLVLAGATGTLYGVLGAVEIAYHARWLLAFANGALLFSTVFLAFSMREVYYNSALAPPEDDRDISLPTLRRIETAFVAVIVVEWLIVLLIDQLAVSRLLKAGGSLAFAVYGLVFADRLEALTSGTTLDTIRRHLIPVLLSAGCLGFVDLAVYVGVDPLVVRSVKNVFVVLVAAFLITATIRLQQNVEGLSPSG